MSPAGPPPTQVPTKAPDAHPPPATASSHGDSTPPSLPFPPAGGAPAWPSGSTSGCRGRGEVGLLPESVLAGASNQSLQSLAFTLFLFSSPAIVGRSV